MYSRRGIRRNAGEMGAGGSRDVPEFGDPDTCVKYQRRADGGRDAYTDDGEYIGPAENDDLDRDEPREELTHKGAVAAATAAAVAAIEATEGKELPRAEVVAVAAAAAEAAVAAVASASPAVDLPASNLRAIDAYVETVASKNTGFAVFESVQIKIPDGAYKGVPALQEVTAEVHRRLATLPGVRYVTKPSSSVYPVVLFWNPGAREFIRTDGRRSRIEVLMATIIPRLAAAARKGDDHCSISLPSLNSGDEGMILNVCAAIGVHGARVRRVNTHVAYVYTLEGVFSSRDKVYEIAAELKVPKKGKVIAVDD